MEIQNFKNHTRIVKGFHGLTFALIIVLLILSVVNLFNVYGEPSWVFTGIMPVLTCIILVLLGWYSRTFALKAQDRAIRAEENFRHYVLTGKSLDSKLRMGQIIALRFASDEEYTALAKRAVNENLSNKDIKVTIKNWKADHNRA